MIKLLFKISEDFGDWQQPLCFKVLGSWLSDLAKTSLHSF